MICFRIDRQRSSFGEPFHLEPQRLTAKLVVVTGCVEGMIPCIDFDAPQAEQN